MMSELEKTNQQNNLPSGWRVVSLGDLFKVKHGFAFKGEFFCKSKTRELVVTPGNFSTNGEFRNIKQKYYNGLIPKAYILNPKDLIITMTDLSKEADTLGFGALIPDDNNIWLHNQRIGLVELKNSNCNLNFLNYLLKNKHYRNWIIASSTGTTVKHTSPNRIESFECLIPPLPEQKAIAHILGKLDDKIELNRQINQTLETMAQTLFKSWFVNFDPVIDNAIKAGNPIPDPLKPQAQKRKTTKSTLPKTTQDLFPNRFVFNDKLKKWIPEGWKVGSILNLCIKIQNGGTPRTTIKEYWENGNIPWLKSGEIKQNIIYKANNNITEFGLKNSSAKIVPKFSTAIAMYGATAGQVAIVSIKTTTNQAICNLIPKENCEYFNYLTFFNKVKILESKATGSAQQNISKKTIEQIEVVIPDNKIIQKFNNTIKVHFDKSIFNLEQADDLSKLRNTLLPKLISGKIRVKYKRIKK